MFRWLALAGMIFFVAGLAGPLSAQDVDATSVEDAFDRAYREYNQCIQEGNFVAAEEPARRALELGREKFGPASRQTGDLAYNYGLVLNRGQKSAEAAKALKEALPIWESVHGANAPALIDVLMELAMASVRSFERSQPFTYFSRAKEIAANSFGAKSEMIVDLHLEFANVLFLTSRYESKKYFEEAYVLSRDAFPEGNYRTGVAAFGLGKILMSGANRKKAESYFVEAIDLFEKSPPPDPATKMLPHSFLVQLYVEAKRVEEAARHLVAIGTIQKDRAVSDYQPVYRTNPVYPIAAADDGKEGFVLIEATVSPEGRVINPVVIESSDSVFEKAALNAMKKWLYAPRIVDGEAVETPGVRYRFNFALMDP